MAQYTLLQVINACMDSIDGWRVSTIDDNLESQQAASIAEDVFHEIVNDAFYNDLSTNIVQLEGLADSAKPNYLKIPTTLSNVHESTIYYNVRTGASGTTTLNWQPVEYCHPQDFLERIGARSTQQANTQTVTDFSLFQMVVLNKKAPSYCTSFDQVYVVFDSFDSDVDSALQQSQNIVHASVQRTFTKSDTYNIDLPEWFQPHYVQLVKARVSEYLRGEPLLSDLRKGEAGLNKARRKARIGNSQFQRKRYGR